MHHVFLIGALIAGGIEHATAVPGSVSQRADARAVAVEKDKHRTYAEIGIENGFTKEQWSSLYDELAGFRYVNGVQVRDIPVPVRRVARAQRRR